MKTLNDLKEGDAVKVSSAYGVYKCKVTRITKTQIIVGGTKFRKADGRKVGADGFDRSYIYTWTNVDEEEYEKEQRLKRIDDTLSMISKLDVKKVSDENIVLLQKIIDEVQKK